MITEVFEMISQLKNIEKQELIITDDDEFIMKAFHRKIKKYVSYYVWRKVVIQFSIDTLNDIYNSSDILVDEIYKKYNKK